MDLGFSTSESILKLILKKSRKSKFEKKQFWKKQLVIQDFTMLCSKNLE